MTGRTKGLRAVMPTLLVLGTTTASICAADTKPQPGKWQARANSIALESVPTEKSNGPTYHVQGRIESGWNYVASDHQPVVAGKLYRLAIDLRVDRLGPGTPPPYFKCEFVGANGRSEAGQVHTELYDALKLHQWQKLTSEFQAPENAKYCWFALEKGTNGPTEIDASFRAVRLESIARLTVFDRYRLKPVPAQLEVVRGVHPRMYLTRDRVAELRKSIETTHAEIWKQVRAQADRAVRSGPPKYIKDDGHSGEEQLWQREVGNALPLLAITYVLSGENKYLEATKSWALASCSYPTWGLGRIDGMDLATGHQLFGLALVYDWCYHDLDKETLRTIRETLRKRGSAIFEAAATGKAWWRRSFLQNHLWVDSTGMAAAGFALFDEDDDALGWIGFPLDIFQKTMASLGPDGASHEGVGYWEYGVEYMLKFMDLSRTLLGVELGDRNWWRKTASYGLYLSLPRHSWTRSNCIVDIGDCPRSHWYGPEYLLRDLAHVYHDGHAQWLASEIDAREVAAGGAPWLNLIWYDPKIAPEPPTDLPTLHHFEDMGIVSARSGWDGDESLVVFKCGPFLGHEAVQRFAYDPGGGHVHPDANHFVVFGAGEWLLRDDGYQSKWTDQHNTLLVNGRGQMGEGAQWFRGEEPLSHKARPKIVHVESTATYDHFVGDATAAYAPESGLKQFTRHLIFVKPDVLIVADDVRTTADADLELRFHPEHEATQSDNAFLAKGKRAVLRIEPLTMEGVKLSQETIAPTGRSGHAGAGMPTVHISTHRREWRNAVALSWSTNTGEPAPVSLQCEGDRWTLESHDHAITLNWGTGRVSTARPSNP